MKIIKLDAINSTNEYLKISLSANLMTIQLLLFQQHEGANGRSMGVRGL